MTFKVGADILTYGSTWDEALDVVRMAGRCGHAYIWGDDHLDSTRGDLYQGFFEGWTTLSVWARRHQARPARLLVGCQHVPQPGRGGEDGP